MFSDKFDDLKLSFSSSIFLKCFLDEIKEAKIMRRFNHANIVNLLGVAAQEYPVMIVLELCPNGALNSKLKKHADIPVEKLIQYTVDACRGMVYLSENKVFDFFFVLFFQWTHKER